MGQVTHALLTRPPLSHKVFQSEEINPRCFVRLACVKHAASVHPEPGSNSLIKFDSGSRTTLGYPVSFYCFWFIEPFVFCKEFSRTHFHFFSSNDVCFTVQLSRFFAAVLFRLFFVPRDSLFILPPVFWVVNTFLEIFFIFSPCVFSFKIPKSSTWGTLWDFTFI